MGPDGGWAAAGDGAGRGRRRDGRQRQGQQFQGGAELLQAPAQLGLLPQQPGQLFPLGFLQVSQGVAGKQGVDAGGVEWGGVGVHGWTGESWSRARRRINPWRARVLTVPRGSFSSAPIADWLNPS